MGMRNFFGGGGGVRGKSWGIFQGYVGKIIETGDMPPKFNSEFTPEKMVGKEDKPFLLGFGNFSGENSLLNFGGW